MKTTLLFWIVSLILVLWVRSEDPPLTWQEHWFEHAQLLNRQGFNDDAAVYYDNDMNRTITWPLEKASAIWKYVKSTYGSFGDDPRLYIILHANKYVGAHPATYFEEGHDYRNTVDIGQYESWVEATGPNIGNMTIQIANLLVLAMKNVSGSPMASVYDKSRWPLVFVFDIYWGLGWQNEALYTLNYANNYNPFRYWIYPIYMKYGQSKVLNRFFDLLASNFTKSPISNNAYKYDRDLNLGEFVHFWSAAAKNDLASLALKAYGTTDLQKNNWEVQLDKARWDFPDLGYESTIIPSETWQEHWLDHGQLLKKQNFTDHAVAYYDNDTPLNITWPLSKASDIWGYVKSTYGTFGSNPRLHVVLHSNKYWGGHYSMYYDESHDYRNVIDIGQSRSWEEMTDWSLDLMTSLIGDIVQYSCKNVYGSPAVGIWLEKKWAEMFTYDVYSQLGWTSDAERVKDKFSSNIDKFPRADTRWFQDWFYPTYTKYGETALLNRFFELLSSKYVKISPGNGKYYYDHDLNLGEFVHFWSGAAKTDLTDLALEVFGPNDEQGNEWSIQLDKAQKDFPGVGYTKENLPETDVL